MVSKQFPIKPDSVLYRLVKMIAEEAAKQFSIAAPANKEQRKVDRKHERKSRAPGSNESAS